jgi:hypothetical protein
MVGETSKKRGAIGGPSQARAGRDLTSLRFFRTKSIDNNLGLEVPDLDGIISRSAQPVSVRREDEAVDNFTSIERVQALSFVQVPKHGGVVLTTTGSKRSIRRDAYGVEVAGVSDQIIAELAVGQVPDLDEAIPTGRHNQGNGLGRREAYARDPLGVALRVAANGVLALTERVPETDGSITGSCDS